MVEAHAHHWVLPMSVGLEVEGVCKLCGARKMFPTDVGPWNPMKQQIKHRTTEVVTNTSANIRREKRR